MQWIKYILKGRVISANEKTKDTIIWKSIIKMNNTVERKYTKYKGVDCIYHNNNMI